MPFGLTNAPATFQHFMNDIFQDMADLFVIVYLDDILIFSKNKEEHRKHVRMVLECLRKYNLFIKPEKCLFCSDWVEFLRFIVSPAGVAMDVEKTAAITKWPVLKNLHDVQSFLGFANFYRQFIATFSDIILPLTRLTRKGTPFSWEAIHQDAFKTLKTAFSQAPVLIHFTPTTQLLSKQTPLTMR